MPQDLRIRVGTEVAQVTLGGTAQQVAAALTRFATSLGIPVDGTPTENLTAVLTHIVDDVRRRSKAAQTAEKQAVSNALIQQEVDADHPL